MDYKALKTQIQRPTIQKLFKYLFLIIVLSVVGVSFAKSAGNASTTSIPKPFFFTENKGQWDEKVLYKCDAGNGLVWFLERDGFTLLATTVDKTLPTASRGTQGGVRDPMDRDLPEMLRRHPPRYPLKGHALKFKFLKEDLPPLLPPNGVRGDNLSSSQAGGRGGVYLPASAKYFEGKSNISQPFSNNVQDVPPLVPPNGVRGDNLSPSQAGGRGGVYLPASAKYFEGLGELPWKNSYFLGNDSTKWAPNCRNFTSVYYKDVWDGIDIEWYESNGKLEFDFIVQPGANPAQIKIAVEGLEGALSLPHLQASPPFYSPRTAGGLNSPAEPPQPKDVERDKGTPTKSPKPVSRTADKWGENTPKNNPPVNGWDRISNPNTILGGKNNPPAVRGGFRGGQTVGDELILPTSLGELRTVLPKVYQIDGSGHVIDIPAKFQLIGNNDKRIHPPIAPPFTGEKANVPITDEKHTGSNIDKGFEINNTKTTNTFGVTLPEGYDPAHPLRIDPLIYSTFLGGSGEEAPHSMKFENTNNILMAGYTRSLNYPTSVGAYQGIRLSSYSGFVSKININTSSLLFSTYLGGVEDAYINGITFDHFGGYVVVGFTNGEFPITNGSFDTSYNGSSDAFISRINSNGSQLIYSTYFGGERSETAYAASCFPDGSCIVAGETAGFIPTTLSAYDTSYNGLYDTDVFIAKLTPIGSQLSFSTYLGGRSNDFCNSVALTCSGDVYVSGYTSSDNFPVTPNAYDTTYNSGTVYLYDCFVAKLNSTGTNLLAGTYLGGSGDEQGSKIIVNQNGNLLLTGQTRSMNFPTTPSAFDSTYNGTSGYWGDCFVARMNSSCTQLLASTFFGGIDVDLASDINEDQNGDVIISGQTSSSNLPTTLYCLYPYYQGGSSDGFVTKFNYILTQLLYSSFVGGISGDGAVNVYSQQPNEYILSGWTVSNNFPTTPNAFDITFNGGINNWGGDCFITIIAGDTSSVKLTNPILKDITLLQCYPNPFNSQTKIEYYIPVRKRVQVCLVNINGAIVSTLLNEVQEVGLHQLELDAKKLASGIYFVTMKVGEFVQTRKIVVMK